jgi:PAS domain S-box-containing protein
MLTDITERRQAEKELLESERRYRLLVESSPSIITVVQNGKFVFVNQRAEQISGFSREELINNPIVKFVHEDDREKVIEINRRKIKGEPVEMPYSVRGISKCGNIYWLEVNSALITWMGAPASLNFYTDITERRQVEEKLRLQALVLDQIRDRVTVTDLQGRITYINDAEIQQLGFSRQELIGQSVEMYGEDASRGATQKEILEKTISEGEWRVKW